MKETQLVRFHKFSEHLNSESIQNSQIHLFKYIKTQMLLNVIIKCTDTSRSAIINYYRFKIVILRLEFFSSCCLFSSKQWRLNHLTSQMAGNSMSGREVSITFLDTYIMGVNQLKDNSPLELKEHFGCQHNQYI